MHRPAAMIAAVLVVAALPARAEISEDQLDQVAKAAMPQVIAWRRDIHQHPELGNSGS